MPSFPSDNRAIKICGVRTAEALDATIDARADYVGFNFYPPSPRFLGFGEAAALGERVSGRISKVGVFVDATDDFIGDAIAAAALDIIQLHGEESPERAARLRASFGIPVWKVISIATSGDVLRAAAYREAADFILFDAKTPKGTLPGGMGLSFDWSLLPGKRATMPWGLAGGLSPDNVADAIRSTGAPLVDTSSGVETEPGVKSVEKITAFCMAARGV